MIWDVVVAGAGPAGCVTAWVLARAGRHVLLVDNVGQLSHKAGESLPAAARPLLRDLGLLTLVEGGAHLPSYGNISAWGTPTLHHTDFIQDPNGHGWHLNRALFDSQLRQTVMESGVDLISGRVQVVTSQGDIWQIQHTTGVLTTRWLIDATGRHASIARQVGAERVRDDGLIALCAWTTPVTHQRDTRTLVESAPDGWWYTARLPDNSRCVVYHTDADNVPSLLQTEGAWETALNQTQHIKPALGDAVLIGKPRATEACGARLNHFYGKNWVAVGDAALSFDPISSQGIFNALYTGLRAGEAVHAALGDNFNLISTYAARLESIRAAYLQRYRMVYRSEQRWSERPFWQQRQTTLVSR